MKKFYQIFQTLEQDIRNKKYMPGDRLPTEIALSKEYGVSRETIRKAQDLLLEKGFIQKKQGVGAIVLDINRFEIAASDLQSFAELQKDKHIDYQISVLKNKKEKLSRKLAQQLNIEENQQVIAVERLRDINKEHVTLDKDFFIASIIHEIPMEKIQGSIYSYIEHELHLTIGYAKKVFTVEPASEEDKILLDIHSDTHVVVIRSEVYLEDARLFQYHESRNRVDQFRFVDFARRKQY